MRTARHAIARPSPPFASRVFGASRVDCARRKLAVPVLYISGVSAQLS